MSTSHAPDNGGPEGGIEPDEPAGDAVAPEALERARTAALRLLKVRQRSRHEIRSRLTTRGFEPPVIATLLVELEELGLIDDEAFARELVAAQLRRRPAGEPFLRSKLFQAGVAGEVASRVIHDALAERDTRADARAFVQRSIRKASPGTPPDRLARRLTGALLRRGVDAGTAREVVREALESPAESEPSGAGPDPEA